MKDAYANMLEDKAYEEMTRNQLLEDKAEAGNYEVQYNYLNILALDIHKNDNHKWWHDMVTGEPLNRNIGELIMLMVSELSEAFEAERKDLMDDKLPHRPGAEVELADAIIRILDYAGYKGYDIDGAIREKRAFNKIRKDHSVEERMKPNGKKW